MEFIDPNSLTNDEYNIFFTASLDMFCISSYDGYFKKVNPAFEHVLGFTPAEMCSSSYLDFIHPDDIEITKLEVEKQLKTGEKVFNFENRYRTKDGRYKLLSWKSVPMGQFMYAVARDITASRENELAVVQARLQTEEAIRELELFSFSVAHDLRAPLRSISSFSAILLEDFGPVLNEEGRSLLARLIKASVKMNKLIDGLLDLSRINRKIISKRYIDMSNLVHEIADELRVHDPARDVDFKIEDGIHVEAEPDLLRAMLDNLLANAWKYTSKLQTPAKVEFGRATVNGLPGFFIRDNGVGFDMKYSDKLFKTFQRLHSTSEFEGIGIGLATVRRIVHRHGGIITAEAQPGMGATFYFTI